MFIYIYLSLLATVLNIIFLPKYLHVFQLRDYQPKRYLRFFKFKYVLYYVVNVIIGINVVFYCNVKTFLLASIMLIVNILLNARLIKSNKTPIKYTPRLKRQFIISYILILLFAPLGIASNSMLVFVPIIANLLNFIDKIKNTKYINLAKEKISLYHTTVIAITGSNGKTSTKNILHAMLSKKYITQFSPNSYNTPLGLAKFINDELKPDTEYLILEFGARKRGDIHKLAKLFPPKYAIITSVCPQHLESFRSIENIYLTKKELSNCLYGDFCVYNMDNLHTLRMYQEKIGTKCGVSCYQNADIIASNIMQKELKTSFIITYNNSIKDLYTNKTTDIVVTTKLLGKYNIINILLACAIALKLGISDNDIKTAISKLQFTPHRLELISGAMNVLDDSYNCSLTSAKQSLEVLRLTKNKKMIMTPGIIECGKYKYQINNKLGQMASFADYVIIVGEENKLAITDGLLLNGYDTKKILYAKSVDSAKQYFGLINNQDTLLILNDLPDDYN